MQATIAQSSNDSIYQPLGGVLLRWLVIGLTSAAILIGWQQSAHSYITPEDGLGYALGIIGGSLMVLMIVYPLRKRLRSLAPLGSVRGWYRYHMLAGTAGPVLILYHANFSTGSLNSTVALISMLTVALSGVIGRYFHQRTSSGLIDSKEQLAQLEHEMHGRLRALGPLLECVPELQSDLERYRTRLVAEGSSLVMAAVRLWISGYMLRRTRRIAMRRVAKALKGIGRQQGWTRARVRALRRRSKGDLVVYLVAVRRVATFEFYRRLLDMWHLLHLPLFIMMLLTGIFHVIAVHMY